MKARERLRQYHLPGKYAVLVCNNSLANASAKIKMIRKGTSQKYCAKLWRQRIIIRTASEGKDSEIENKSLCFFGCGQYSLKESKARFRESASGNGLHVRLRGILNKDVKGFVINDRDRYNELLDYLDVSPD